MLSVTVAFSFLSNCTGEEEFPHNWSVSNKSGGNSSCCIWDYWISNTAWSKIRRALLVVCVLLLFLGCLNIAVLIGIMCSLLAHNYMLPSVITAETEKTAAGLSEKPLCFASLQSVSLGRRSIFRSFSENGHLTSHVCFLVKTDLHWFAGAAVTLPALHSVCSPFVSFLVTLFCCRCKRECWCCCKYPTSLLWKKVEISSSQDSCSDDMS